MAFPINTACFLPQLILQATLIRNPIHSVCDNGEETQNGVNMFCAISNIIFPTDEALPIISTLLLPSDTIYMSAVLCKLSC